MNKFLSSKLSFLSSWFGPFVIKFEIVHGGIEIQLLRNNYLLKNWEGSILHKVLPEPLVKWIDDYHINIGPQPYPIAKQFLQYLQPLASKKLLIDSSALADLEEISQPRDLALIWKINYTFECIEGSFEGADRYLGMGWFQKGKKIWPLKNFPPFSVDAQLRNLQLPLQQAKFLLNSIAVEIQQYVPTRIDFQLITDFSVKVIVLEAHNGLVNLAEESNYPQFLPITRIPQQKIDVLLTNRAIIQFSHEALTPALVQLLCSNSPIKVQGADVPLFIREQLPIIRRFSQISDDMATKIIQTNPIMPIASLSPSYSIVHTHENGIGKYIISAIYQYQNHTLNMPVLLSSRSTNKRFVQQHAIWFEWPHDSYKLVQSIQQNLVEQVLRPEEVMGFDIHRTALYSKEPLAPAIQPQGTTPFKRGESLFKQLRSQGLPGGIIGETKGLLTMFLNTCKDLLLDNHQARILWLTPSNKKGSVTRLINDTTISSSVVVASLVTLRDEPALLSRPWTMVIFQGLDMMLDGSLQSVSLPQLQWQWAITSVTSLDRLNPFIMRILHLPDQYYLQFRAHYLFNLETYSASEATKQITHGMNPVRPTPKPTTFSSPIPQRLNPIRPIPQPVTFSPPVHQPLELNQKKIAILHQESEQLQERLSIEAEEEQEQLAITAHRNAIPVSPVKAPSVSLPELDEDWQIILQQWRPEHLEGISLLYQGKSEQLKELGHKVRRPASQLIDEINTPVDQQIGDLLVDPETLALSPHLLALAEKLNSWYSSKERLISS